MDPDQKTNNPDKTPDIFEAEKPINWRKYIFLILTNWYWFLITVSIALSVAYLKNRYTLPTYRATATLLFEDESESSDLISEIKSVKRARRATDLANEMAKLKAFSLHRRTIDSLHWDIFWTGHGRVARVRPLYFNPPYYIETDPTSDIWYRNQTFYVERINDEKFKFYNNNLIDTVLTVDEWTDLSGWKFRFTESGNFPSYASYSFIIYNPNNLARQQLSKLSVELSENQGTVITISSHGPIFDKESDYVNMLTLNYIQSGLERKRLIADNTLDFIENQINIIRDSLHNAEKQLLAFRVNNNIVDISREGQQAYENLQSFYDQKTKLALKRNYYEYLRDYVNSKRDPQSIIAPILIDANDHLLITQVENIQRLYEQRETLSFSASGDNPGLIQLNSRIHSARDKIMEIIEGLIINNDLAWQQIDIEENLIEKQLLQLPVSEQELLNIQRKYEVSSQFYTFLLQKRAEAGIKKASTVSNIRILNESSHYTIAVSGSRKNLVYLIALIIGLIIPLGVIFLVDFLDNRIKDRSDIEENTNLPILGVVAHFGDVEDIPVYARPGSAFSEAFRHIRTNLQYILHHPDKKIIMVTSTISGEGKTFIALNLASILAMNNKKVLLAGFDLRRPSLHRIFQLDNKTGISTYLAGIDSFEEICFPTRIEGLDVMIAGPVPPNPAELLETDRMENIMKQASEKYDYIIIDTPPVALVTDAMLISKHTHANIFVIRQYYSPKDVVAMINKVSGQQIKPVSLLINDIRESKTFGYRYYYGYSYTYNYSYKYGSAYYQDDQKNSS